MPFTRMMAAARWAGYPADGDSVLCKEIRALNDNNADSHFVDEVGRSPEMEEDRPA